MKTPRELLLNRHRQVEPKLNALRADFIQSLTHEPEEAVSLSAGERLSVVATVWQELFVSCRRYWMGLGLAWSLIIVFAVMEGANRTEGTMMAAGSSASVVQAVRDQQRLRDELLGIEVMQRASAEHADPASRPRSEIDSPITSV